MGMESVAETSENHQILTQLSAREHFIAPQSFKTFSIINVFLGKRETFPTNIFLQPFPHCVDQPHKHCALQISILKKSHGLWSGKHDGHKPQTIPK